MNVETKISRMLAGERVIMSDSEMEAAERSGHEIRSAFNAKRLGIHDTYVAWIGHANQPADLVFRYPHAFGSR